GSRRAFPTIPLTTIRPNLNSRRRGPSTRPAPVPPPCAGSRRPSRACRGTARLVRRDRGGELRCSLCLDLFPTGRAPHDVEVAAVTVDLLQHFLERGRFPRDLP